MKLQQLGHPANFVPIWPFAEIYLNKILSEKYPEQNEEHELNKEEVNSKNIIRPYL